MGKYPLSELHPLEVRELSDGPQLPGGRNLPRPRGNAANPHRFNPARVRHPTGTDVVPGAVHAGRACHHGAEQSRERCVRRRYGHVWLLPSLDLPEPEQRLA